MDIKTSISKVYFRLLIDVRKKFREQVLRWFTIRKIPSMDSVSILYSHFFLMFMISAIFCRTCTLLKYDMLGCCKDALLK